MKRFLAALASTLPFALGAQTLQFGNLDVTQLNFNNNPGDIVVAIAPGGTPGFTIPAVRNRADYNLSFGNPSDTASGVLISSVRQNGRDDSATGNPIAPFYATTATSSDASGYFLSLFRAAQGDEVNMNVAFGYFPYSQYFGGVATNAANNTVLTSIVASPGITLGTGQPFQNTATAGQYTLDLTSFGASSDEGVLLVNGAKNEDNYALSRPNADGSFSIFCKDNEATGANYEADPVAFVYLPASGVGSNQLAAIGRVNQNASTDIAAGAFIVTKGGVGQWYLSIPGHSNSTGVLIVSPEWGGAAAGGAGNMLDNIISAEWDSSNGRWVIESRDLTNATTTPSLEDGIDPAEDVFSFAFLTTGAINPPPIVALTTPADGATISQGVPFTIEATASDAQGIAKVEFYDGSTKLGEDLAAPYAFSVSSLSLGTHVLRARAIDTGGAAAMSATRAVTVQPPGGAGGLFFDGTNDYVTFGNNPVLGLGSFTLELWFRRDGPGVTASSGSGGVAVVPLISKGRGESDGSTVDCNYLFGIQGTTGRLAADFEDLATGLNHPIVGTNPVSTGTWQHAAVTFDAATFEWRLYLNGGLEATGTTGGQVPRSDSIQHSALGAALNSTGVPEGAFFGLMDEVRIWNRARTQFEIQATINQQLASAPGLVARWSMSEGSGPTLTSTAASTITGTLTNGPVWSTGAPFNANPAPFVAITSPSSGTTYLAPAAFIVEASAADANGSVAQVEFLRDGVVIATDDTAPYELTQTNLGSGTYRYTVRAVDDLAASAVSSAVTVIVNFDPTSPPSNTALRFDGVDDFVTMGVAPELNLGGPPSNAFTIECWFRKEGAGIVSGSGSGGVSGVPLFGKGRGESDGSNVDCGYFFGIDAAGRLVADFETYPAPGLSAGQNYPVIGTNAPIQNGTWHHAAATYDGATATWKLFLDGVQVGSATAAVGARPRFDTIQHFGIATAMNSSGVREGAFAGRIDEVRLWNIVRTPAQIAAAKDFEISAADGLIARYGLNEAAGTSVENSTTVTGAPVGAVVGNPTWVEGAPFSTINVSPSIVLDAPAAGASSVYPAAFTFAATAADADGSIARVEFFVEGVKVGEDNTAPYAYAWTPPAVGSYQVVARAIDNLGATETSQVATLSVTPNPNQPPVATPTSPVNNATGIGSSVLLTANVADPEGDGTTVTFYGRKTTPATPGPDFTLVTIPDTQYYSQNTGGTRLAHFLAQTNWIVSQRDVRNIAFVTHMGDIVENGDSIPQQWVNANQAMTVLENHATTLRAYGIPFGAAPGNHDQASIGNPESATFYYNQYFGVNRYLGRPYWGGNYGANNDNNYQLFSASGLDFIIIHLEYRTAADPAVIAWADALLKAHPHRRALVTSHWIVGGGNPANFGGQGQQIYDGLKNNPNLFMLLCGHIHAEGRRTDVYQGRTVYSILQDYQGAANGGNGFLRYYTFSPASNTITSEAYSPSLGRAPNATDGIPTLQGTFVLPYDMQSPVSDWIPLGTVSLAPGETVAQLTWTGLEKASHYEWRAMAFDGINQGSSPSARFSTANAFSPVVTLAAPVGGATYTAPAAVTLKATATDPDGTVARVDFFLGTTKLGSDATAPYELTAPPQGAGTYTFSAVAIDNENRASLSAIANVTVANRSNVPPTIALTAPTDGTRFLLPAAVTLSADASDNDGNIDRVEFYADGVLVGTDNTSPYSFAWANAAPGAHSVVARAFDNDTASTTSASVNLTVGFTAAAAGTDLDGDLLSALLEYALGTDARSPNRAGLPTLGIDAGRLTLTFLHARGDVSYVVEASDDLKIWTILAASPGSVGENVTVVDANTSSPNRYLRLSVTADGVTHATTPFGRMTYVFPKNQETALSLPLNEVLGAVSGQAAGFISGLGARTLENSSASWMPGQLSQATTPYLLRITRGNAAGRTFLVSTALGAQNTATQLSLVAEGVDLNAIGVVPGADTYELLPADTLASLFPAGTLQSGTEATADRLRMWNGSAWETYFHNGSFWQNQGGANADATAVLPHQGWMLFRRGATTSLVMLGQVSATPANVRVARGGSSFVSLLPVAETFTSFPLQALLPGWTSNLGNPTAGDHVRLWSGAAWLNYYHDGATWKRQGAPADAGSTVLLKPGRPILIVRPAGTGADNLIQNKTY